MKQIKLLKWVLGFLILNLFANGVPFIISNYPKTLFAQLFIKQPFFWIIFWISFFVLSFLVAKYFLKLKGLSSLGLKFQKKRLREIGVGFLMGFLLWAIKNLVFFGTGMFEVAGLIDLNAIPGLLALALLVAFFPAAINDILIRGYFFCWFKKYNLLAYFIFTTAFVYAFDDFWNEGFSATNFFFSLFLGISLAVTVIRTGAIWMSIGIHTGSNFVYRMMYGLDGQGIFVLENFNSSPIYEYINILLVIFLIPIVFLFPKNRQQSVNLQGKPIFKREPE